MAFHCAGPAVDVPATQYIHFFNITTTLSFLHSLSIIVNSHNTCSYSFCHSREDPSDAGPEKAAAKRDVRRWQRGIFQREARFARHEWRRAEALHCGWKSRHHLLLRSQGDTDVNRHTHAYTSVVSSGLNSTHLFGFYGFCIMQALSLAKRAEQVAWP